MHNPRLIKRKNNWYLVDDIVPPTEGGLSIYCNLIPVFTNFIDDDKEICSIPKHYIPTYCDSTVSFNDLETVMGSTNLNDGTPMLDKSKFDELGITDENDYFVDYTITFASGSQLAQLIDGFVNILRIKKK